MKNTSKLVEYLAAAGMILGFLAVYLAWRSLLGQDGGVMRLLERLF
jgi:hypothetical protein